MVRCSHFSFPSTLTQLAAFLTEQRPAPECLTHGLQAPFGQPVQTSGDRSPCCANPRWSIPSGNPHQLGLPLLVSLLVMPQRYVS
jgi:hypothetical protein